MRSWRPCVANRITPMLTLVLSQSDVRAVLTMESAIAAVEDAFAAHGRGEALMPAKVYLGLPQHHRDFRAMPAYLGEAAVVEWVIAPLVKHTRQRLHLVLAL